MSFNKVWQLIFSWVYLVFVGLSSIVFFSIACLIRLLTFLFDRRRVANNLFSSFWASVYLWCMPNWSVKIIGQNKLNPKKSYVIVSNHQSQLDILVIYRLFFPMRWISKAEVFKIPFIGWNMLLNGDVKLKRGHKDSIENMMNQCETLLDKKNSIMIFPEGTRSRTGHVKAFKPGAFILAKKKKKAILPLVINNSKDALPKHSMQVSGHHKIEIKILDEIPYAVFKEMEVSDLADMVRQKIVSHVNINGQ